MRQTVTLIEFRKSRASTGNRHSRAGGIEQGMIWTSVDEWE
jgi:hypothetical protein